MEFVHKNLFETDFKNIIEEKYETTIVSKSFLDEHTKVELKRYHF